MGIRRTIDTSRLSTAVSRPGIDPRMWLDLAIITSIYADAEENVFADVTMVSDGRPETVMMGGPYAGNGFGAYFPFEVDDTVLVAVPAGDPNLGPVIVSRMWNKADKPIQEVGSGLSVSNDVTIRVKEGQKINIIVSGAGDVIINAEGSGKIYLGGNDGSEPIALATTLKGWMQQIFNWLTGHTHSGVTAGGGVTGTFVPANGAVPTVPDIEAKKGQVK